MVSVSLRQEPVWAPERNTVEALERGVPAWAIPDYRCPVTGRRPASPWDEWRMPPVRPDRLAHIFGRPIDAASIPNLSTGASANANANRGKAPSPSAGDGSAQSLAWRVAFDTREAARPSPSPAPREATGPSRPARAPSRYEPRTAACNATPSARSAPRAARPTTTATPPAATLAPSAPDREPNAITRRLVLLLGLAYLVLTALATGLIWTTTNDDGADADAAEANDGREPVDARPPAPPLSAPHPNAPGTHSRPDGTRYLIMPLPAEVADRLRGHGSAFALGGAR